jgi:hypothetical protein
VSQRFLVGKALSVFVCEDRTGFLSRVAELVARRTEMQFELRVRPRERAPMSLRAIARADETSVRWHFGDEQLLPSLPADPPL